MIQTDLRQHLFSSLLLLKISAYHFSFQILVPPYILPITISLNLLKALLIWPFPLSFFHQSFSSSMIFPIVQICCSFSALYTFFTPFPHTFQQLSFPRLVYKCYFRIFIEFTPLHLLEWLPPLPLHYNCFL